MSPALATLLPGKWQWIAGAALAVLAAFLLGRCDGVRSERARQDVARAEANARALARDAAASEAAATERAGDVSTIEARHKEQTDAIKGDDDAAVRRNAACQRLRAQGTRAADLPPACRSGG